MSKDKNKSKFATEEVIDSLNDTAIRAENFLEKNSKIILSVVGIIVLAAVGYFLYLKLVVEKKSEEAMKEMYQADQYFEKDSINYALNGSAGSFQGYKQLVDEYGNTDAGNLAKFKAGVSSFKLGDFASAVKYLQDFKTDDPITLAQKYGMIGNALTQSNKLDDALPYFVKAAEATDTEVFQSLYYTKAGQLAMTLNKNDEALKYFQIITEKYPNLNNGEAEKYVERLKYATGKID